LLIDTREGKWSVRPRSNDSNAEAFESEGSVESRCGAVAVGMA
jgi:hypothetical protein